MNAPPRFDDQLAPSESLKNSFAEYVRAKRTFIARHELGMYDACSRRYRHSPSFPEATQFPLAPGHRLCSITNLPRYTGALMCRIRWMVAAGFMGLLFVGCRSGEQKPNNASAILITVDTLRADHLACYGYRNISTPAIDRLAQDGVLFRQDIAQVPLTLPSHCSLLTGLLPAGTGVRDQAGSTLPAATPTIAGLLKAAGLQTAAFVASSVLNAETGLNHGFDMYSGVSPRSGGSPGGEGLERRGDQVITEALDWIRSAGRTRFFAWIHVYDPHTPYDAPEPYRTRYAAAPYDGEIAFVDSLIGQFLEALNAGGLYDNTLIALTSDHGESLGEHGESTHGFFLYDSTVRVPLIVKFPGSRWKGRVVEEQVRGIDIAPTILEALAVGVPPQMQGAALAGLAAANRQGASRPALSETHYPYYHFGWSPLLSIRSGQYKFIRAPRPELYDLTQDPGEQKNIAAENPSIVRELESQLRGSEVPPKPKNNVDPATVAKLKSLGYIGSGPTGRPGPLADPKDKVGVYTLLENALRDGEQGRLQESNQKLRQVLREEGDLMDAHLNLGVNLAQLGDVAGAAESFRRALRIDPRNVVATYNLALAYAQMGKLGQAIAGFRRTLEIDPRQVQARLDLGRAYAVIGKTDLAIEAFERVLADDPKSGEAHFQLARAYNQKGWKDRAQSEAMEAQRLGFREPNQ